MFVIMTKKKHEAHMASIARMTEQVEAAREMVTLVDNSFTAMDSRGRSNADRDISETTKAWNKLWTLSSIIHR